MSGFFEHISAFDDQKRDETRVAVAVAHRRFTTRFAGFLHEANTLDEYQQRIALVEDEIKEMVDDVVAEYGGDSQKLEASLKETKGGFCDDCKKWKSGPKKGCTCGDEESEDRSDGDPDLSDNSDEEKDDSSDSKEETVEETSDSSHDSSAKQADLTTQPIMTPVPLPDEPGKGVPDIDGELEDAPSAVGYGTIASETPAMQKARQLITAKLAADAPTGDSAEKRKTLPTGDESALGGPSPKIDKRKWKPKALGEPNLHPIDTEGKGSPHPTEHQDIVDKPDYERDNFLKGTEGNGTTKHKQKLDKDTGDFQAPHTDTWSGTDGLANPVTQTAISSTHVAEGFGQPWGEGAGYAEPYAPETGAQPYAHPQDALIPCPNCGAASGEFDGHHCVHCGYQAQEQVAPQQFQGKIDPDKNPVRDILEAKVDFAPQDDVMSAIAHFEQS